jgi:hypothetical protein
MRMMSDFLWVVFVFLFLLFVVIVVEVFVFVSSFLSSFWPALLC